MNRFWIAIFSIAVAAAQQPAAPTLETMLAQAREEIRTFEKAGGKKDDAKHPVGKWSDALWALYERSPRAPDGSKAAVEAVHLLVHAGRFGEVRERVERVPADDPAWENLPEILVEAGSIQNDFAHFFQKLPSVLSRANSATVRAAVQWNLGRVWMGQNQEEKARAAFEEAVKYAPASAAGRLAEEHLYELLHLGPGQPAPTFSTAAMDGSRVSLAEYRGKPVVLVFWSSSCGVCAAEVPLLQQLYWKYHNRGLVVIGVSLDEDRPAAERFIAQKKIPWPQLWDAKAEKGEVPQLYHVQETPVLFVIDRAGNIAARLQGAALLDQALFEVAGSDPAPPRTPRDAWQRPVRVAESLGVRAGSVVADVGAGGGYFTFHLAARVGATGKVYAEDLSERELAPLRERAEKESLAQIRTVLGAQDDPRLPESSLDAALIVDAFHEFTRPDVMAGGIARALKPGGRLGIIDRTASLSLKPADYMDRHILPHETVIEHAARAGLRLISFEADFAGPSDGNRYYFAVFEKPAGARK